MTSGLTNTVDAIIFSSVDWDFVWQGQQEIAVRLARLGGRVLYVENTTVRGPRLSDAPRVMRRLVKWLRGTRRAATAPKVVSVLSPLIAPYPWKSWSRTINRRLFVSKVRRLADALREPLVWSFLATPVVLDAVRACRKAGSVVIYYCVADFEKVVDDKVAFRRVEQELLREADLVFVNGEALRRRFAANHPCVRVYPFGVNAALFSPRADLPEPPALAAVSRPRAGYIGGLHRHVAIDWLRFAAQRLPQVSFVLVGPAQVDVSALASLPNIHLIGQQPHSSLPAFVKSFDVCLVPYVDSDYTRSVVPTKLFEYLAMGRPVVSSALPEVLALRLPTSVLRIAADAESFVVSIAQTIDERSSEADCAARVGAVARYSWDRQFAAMLEDVRAVRETRGRQT